MLAGRLTCTQQPQSILLGLMEPYLRTGRPEQAVDAHRRAYRLIRGSLADLWDIGEHIEFCARTGNEHRGLEILRRHIDWLDKAPSPAAGMVFAAAGALLLRRLTELGHGDAEVRRGPSTMAAAALGDELAAYATAQAARFDERNGTSARSERIASVLEAEPYDQVLPLSPTARRGTPARAAAPAPPPDVPEADAGTLIRLAEEHEREDRHAGVTAVLAAFDRRFPDAEALDPEIAARRMMLLGTERWKTSENPEPAIASWERGVELFDAAGQAIEASEARGRLGMARCVLGDAETGLPLVEADLAVQEERGDAASRARARARFAVAMVTQGRYEEGVAAQDRAVSAAAETGDARMVARYLTRKAHYLLGQHRHADAEAAAAEAAAFYREHGPAESLALADLLYARAALDREKVVTACTEVLDLGDPAHAAEARSTRGYALLRLNRHAEAVTDFVEWVALCAEQGDETAGAFARLELARAYLGSGRSTEAAEVAEEAIIWMDRGGHAEGADDARLLSARAYLDLGANEDAADPLHRAGRAAGGRSGAPGPDPGARRRPVVPDGPRRRGGRTVRAGRRGSARGRRPGGRGAGVAAAGARPALGGRAGSRPGNRRSGPDPARRAAQARQGAGGDLGTGDARLRDGRGSPRLGPTGGSAGPSRRRGAEAPQDRCDRQCRRGSIFCTDRPCSARGRPAQAEALLRRLLHGLAEDNDLREAVDETPGRNRVP